VKIGRAEQLRFLCPCAVAGEVAGRQWQSRRGGGWTGRQWQWVFEYSWPPPMRSARLSTFAIRAGKKKAPPAGTGGARWTPGC